MANVRINALTTTATSAANDDYLAIDGTTNGTRKILGSSFALLSGATFTGTITSTLGTLTTSTPALDASQTWNAAGTTFTGLKLNVTNTASAAGSLLADLQVGGTSQFKVDKGGAVTSNSGFTAGGNILTGSGSYLGWNGGTILYNSYNSTGGFSILSSSGPGIGTDTGDTIVLRRSTNPLTFRVYNTYTSGTSYERLGLNWATNVAQIYTEAGSGGGTARDLVLGTNATKAISIGGTDQSTTFSGVTVLKAYTVSTLPTASSYTYGTAFVSDATQAAGTSIGSSPTGGGSVKRAVYSDGTNWLLL